MFVIPFLADQWLLDLVLDSLGWSMMEHVRLLFTNGNDGEFIW